MRIGDSWRLRDTFGREWLITVHPPWKESDERERWEQTSTLRGLVYFSFQSHGATDDRIARVLLEVHDELTGDDLARRLPHPTRDPQRRLRGFDDVLRRRLEHAARTGFLRIERVPERPWPFAEEEKPEATAPESLVEEQTTWVGVRLVDQDGNPVSRRGVRFVLSDKTERTGFLGSEGRMRLEDVPSGTARATFSDLDRSDFSPRFIMNGTEPPDAVGPIEVEEEPESGFVHEVGEGETLSSIAGRFGFLHFATIWNHEANASLRAGRADPHMLLPGDGVVVPEKNVPTYEIPTGTETTFTVYAERLQLKVRALSPSGDPQQLDPNGISSDQGDVTASGDAGSMTIDIPLETSKVSLAELPETPCEVGALPPIAEEGGLEGRLENLGFFVSRRGITESDEDDATSALLQEGLELALELFEEAQGQPPKGTRSPDVLAALKEAAGT